MPASHKKELTDTFLPSSHFRKELNSTFHTSAVSVPRRQQATPAARLVFRAANFSSSDRASSIQSMLTVPPELSFSAYYWPHSSSQLRPASCSSTQFWAPSMVRARLWTSPPLTVQARV